MRQPDFPLMVFAAGLGTRMRALTAHRPKPLIPVAGRTLLDRALDLAALAGAAPIVVNTHYLGDQIAAHLQDRPIRISDEADRILETGGGLRKALPLLRPDPRSPGPVMTLNPDAVFVGPNPLRLLADAWDDNRMDALLLVMPTARVHGRTGRADFTLDDAGRIRRATGTDGMVYLGAQILRTDGLADIPDAVFSLNRLWDRMIVDGRAHAIAYPGDWCDVGSPEGLALAETMLAPVRAP